MNRFNWTYLDDRGSQHQVGLMHGPESGHLLVYCNSKIVLIDFRVLTDAEYSFFINEELCELSIEKRGKQFLYGFEINRKADTPLNRERKKRNKKDLVKSLVFLGGLMLVVTAFISGLMYFNDQKAEQSIDQQLVFSGLETKAKVLLASETDDNSLSYFFTVNGKAYQDKILQNNESIVLKNGMPLEMGDEFVVKYLPYNPKKNQIYYERPTTKQLSTYKARAVKKHLEYNPGLDPGYCSCMIETGYQIKGLDAIADFYFQKTSAQENSQHNRDSFHRLTRSEEFKEAVAKKCSGI